MMPTALTFFVGLNLLLLSCTHVRVRFPIEEQASLSDLHWRDDLVEGAANIKAVGKARADEKGSIFDNCERLVERAIFTLADEARALKGNTIGRQLWFPGDAETYTTPRCKRRWAFFLFPPLVFSPWFMSATVEAPIFATD